MGILMTYIKIMNTLSIKPGDIVKLSSVQLPKGTFIKIQPQSVDFLDITDPKAVLENAMRHFTSLTLKDKICISYNSHEYEIEILEVNPRTSDGISVIETDLEVDFAAPIGYEDPSTARAEKSIASSFGSLVQSPSMMNRGPFSGSGQKLNGKSVQDSNMELTPSGTPKAPPAAINLPPGKLFFGMKTNVFYYLIIEI